MDNMIVVLFVAVIVVGAGLLVFIALTRRPSKALNQAKYQQDWLAIEQAVSSEQASLQFAIMQADKLLDRALKERGFGGNTMGERMASASREFTKREAAWAAHKLRNRIAHEDNVALSLSLTKKALASFKKALRDLGAL